MLNRTYFGDYHKLKITRVAEWMPDHDNDDIAELFNIYFKSIQDLYAYLDSLLRYNKTHKIDESSHRNVFIFYNREKRIDDDILEDYHPPGIDFNVYVDIYKPDLMYIRSDDFHDKDLDLADLPDIGTMIGKFDNYAVPGVEPYGIEEDKLYDYMQTFLIPDLLAFARWINFSFIYDDIDFPIVTAVNYTTEYGDRGVIKKVVNFPMMGGLRFYQGVRYTPHSVKSIFLSFILEN